MNTIKPPKVFTDIEPVMDFASLLREAGEDQRDIKDVRIYGARMNCVDFEHTGFKNTVFENCQFIDCDLSDCSFTDVIFKNCDFSNSSFLRGYFKYCAFTSVKAMGALFCESRMNHVTFGDCNLEYANLDSCIMASVFMGQSDFSHGALSACRFKDVCIKECRFIESSFFKTILKGLDFSDSELAGIQISDDFKELEGAAVNTWQAVELARLLKLVIKDM